MPNFLSQILQNGVAVSLNGHTHGIAIPRGTSFPASPTLYDLYQRTDLGVICEWDAARWLGPIERVPMPVWIGAPPFATSPTWPNTLPIGNENLYILSFEFVTVVQTTNNATNYWTIYATNGTTNIGSVTTAADTAGASVYKSLSINSVVAGSGYLQTKVQKTNNPGAIFISSVVKFRRVYT